MVRSAPATRTVPHQDGRILLIDSDIGALASLAVILRMYVPVDTASSVPVGLRRLREFRPDIVILGAGPFDLDHPSVLRALSTEYPVILLTAPGKSEAAGKWAAFPLAGLFPKPPPINQLLERTNAILAPGSRAVPLAPRLSRYVAEALGHLGHRYDRPLTVEGVATAIGISPGHLAHLFRAETGMTLKQYVAKVRIEAAKHLLLNREEKLKHIAEILGFCDASHLSRVFRKHVGRWPGEYRRQLLAS